MLAERAGTPLGYAAGSIQIAPQLTVGRVGLLEEIFVLPPVESTGTGRLLADAVFAGLRAAGAQRQQVRVLPANARAMGFWQQQGFQPSLVTLERSGEK